MDSVNEYLRNLVTATEAMIEGASRGLLLGAEHLLDSSRQIVPKETGDLERSGVASVDRLAAAVSYDTEYAVAQHEDAFYSHDAGRDWKYLERPMATEAETIKQLIAQGVAGGLADMPKPTVVKREYTTKDGRTILATEAQIKNWTKGR